MLVADKHIKYLIIGAGPAGLTLANRLLDKENDELLVIERESTVGGLCRSLRVDDGYIDIGGNHVLEDSENYIKSYLFRFLDRADWEKHVKDYKIDFGGKLNASEFTCWPIEDNLGNERSLSEEGFKGSGYMQGKSEPNGLEDWITWRFGNEIAEKYMLPYNRKIYGNILDKMDAKEKSKLHRSVRDKDVENLKKDRDRFYYPKEFGFGEVWARMGQRLEDRDRLMTNSNIITIDLDNTVAQIMKNGLTINIQADIIVNTAPWTEISLVCCDKSLATRLREWKNYLEYTSLSVEYSSEDIDSTAQMVYMPSTETEYYKATLRKNLSATAKGISLEKSVSRSKSRMTQNGYISQYGRPVNILGKYNLIEEILDDLCERGIFGLGQWGEWKKQKSTDVAKRAMDLSLLF